MIGVLIEFLVVVGIGVVYEGCGFLVLIVVGLLGSFVDSGYVVGLFFGMNVMRLVSKIFEVYIKEVLDFGIIFIYDEFLVDYLKNGIVF